MRTIFKYELSVTDTQTLSLHGKILTVGVQGSSIMLWAVHDDDALARQVRVSVRGTGHLMGEADERDYIGTVFLDWLVFHVFARELMLGER